MSSREPVLTRTTVTTEIEQARARGWTLERTCLHLGVDAGQVAKVWAAMDAALASDQFDQPGIVEAGVDEVVVERIMTGLLVSSHRRLAAERLEAIRRLTAQGFNDGEIAARVGLTASGVFAIRKRNRIDAAQPRPEHGTGLRWSVPGRRRAS